MSRNDCRVILNVELLEEHCALATLTPGAVVAPQPALLSAIPTTESSALATRIELVRGISPTLEQLPAAAPNPALPAIQLVASPAVQAPVFNPFANLPVAAGTQPFNGSIPNAAAVQSGLAGLNGLSPFLPTYNLNYTQVGPVYTGSGPGISGPQTSSNDSSYDMSQVEAPTALDDAFILWAA